MIVSIIKNKLHFSVYIWNLSYKLKRLFSLSKKYQNKKMSKSKGVLEIISPKHSNDDLKDLREKVH